MSANIYIIREYIKKYNSDITLGELLRKEIGTKFKCPKCNGRGEKYVADTNYDLGGCHFSGYIKCDLCDGKGYTEKHYKPRYVQDGFEEIE